MSCKAVVLYPNDHDITFDLEYYLSSHMPLVYQTWSKYGLQTWEVIRFGEGPDGSRPQYLIGATMVWTSGADLKAAMDDAGSKEVFADIVKFTNKQPIFLAGDIVGSS